MISVLTPTIRPSGLEETRKSLLLQSYRDFEWLVDINWSGVPDINASYNRMLRRAKGDIIVSLQDNIVIGSGALEHIAQSLGQRFVTYPVSNGGEWDWRKTRSGKIDGREWEIDFGACPTELLKEIGGFDEELDYPAWGFDNVSVGIRAEMKGYEIACDNTILAIGTPHERKEMHEHRNPEYSNAVIGRYATQPMSRFE